MCETSHCRLTSGTATSLGIDLELGDQKPTRVAAILWGERWHWRRRERCCFSRPFGSCSAGGKRLFERASDGCGGWRSRRRRHLSRGAGRNCVVRATGRAPSASARTCHKSWAAPAARIRTIPAASSSLLTTMPARARSGSPLSAPPSSLSACPLCPSMLRSSCRDRRGVDLVCQRQQLGV